jgi:FkbM family methyltransferase
MKIPQNIAVIFIGLGKYSLFYDRFYESIQENFLPDTKKQFFIFSDEDFLVRGRVADYSDDETFIKTGTFNSARDIKLHKFHFIKSAWDKIKEYEYVVYFDADNLVRQPIKEEDFFNHNKALVGVVHPWGSIRDSKEKFESNPLSGAFIEEDKINILYHQSCFWGGTTSKIEEMVNECYDSLEKDIETGHKNKDKICDEVHVNRYFALNEENLHSLGKEYANPGEAYQAERNAVKKPFGNDIIISHDNANQTYKNSLLLLEQQKENKRNFNFAGWAQVKDNTKATFEMLKKFKNVNPDAHVHITNSGQKNYEPIYKGFHCSYNDDKSIKGWSSGNRVVEYDIWSWLNNLKEVCSIYLKNYDWIVLLEDDVESFCKPQKEPEYALGGPNGPSMGDSLYKIISEKYPDRELPKRYTGCGGSLLNRKCFIKCMETMTEEKWREYTKIDRKLEIYADIALSFLLMQEGYPVGEWNEFTGWTDERKEYYAFAHGNKEFYGEELKEEDLEELNYIRYSKIYINDRVRTTSNQNFVPKERLSKINDHSFFSYLLSKNGVCLDVGCRNFEFSKVIKDSFSKIIAIDPGPDIEPPEDEKIIFLNQALTTSDLSSVYLVRDGRLTWHYISFEKISHNCLKVPNISLDNLMKTLKIKEFDLIKLDCEGSEYSLMYWLAKHPVAKQISVNFHDWCNRNPYSDPENYYSKLFEKLRKNYHIYQHKKNKKGDGSSNYDDSLFIRK